MQEFLDSDSSGITVVARLPTDIQAQLGAKTTCVFLSSETRDSHKKHGWTAEDFACLQAVLDDGEVRTDRERHVVVACLEKEWWLASLKTTMDRREVYLLTFHRSNKRQIAKFSQSGRLVRPARNR
ncbi:hypothetical protein [Azospirillum rugosum]|uniref:Phage-Barnase-EndoU-ColicinE5/D-RelE like nuclease 2 domain-containing protein n=1 Tax=Azospirillum rugosum TaxID=416170 RepID=A0ABS4SKP5_9PROT|nr:hypothetical protein [Azospirillum rugosum]MBP2293131.1 hypothetical protein [Azospirillum rugosum]MDQ0526680.1 hypothetical protein [Azospirillum rugosum]